MRSEERIIQRYNTSYVGFQTRALAVMEIVEKHNIDLSQSYAYGDTAGIFYVATGHPPPSILQRLRKYWMILLEKITIISSARMRLIR